ncbi:MAG: hypothetical protein JWL81_415 [Verrucomicrobiales bacterium]|nr:hypothetical protein [Verrucomicrobiales bacterium]
MQAAFTQYKEILKVAECFVFSGLGVFWRKDKKDKKDKRDKRDKNDCWEN